MHFFGREGSVEVPDGAADIDGTSEGCSGKGDRFVGNGEKGVEGEVLPWLARDADFELLAVVIVARLEDGADAGAWFLVFESHVLVKGEAHFFLELKNGFGDVTSHNVRVAGTYCDASGLLEDVTLRGFGADRAPRPFGYAEGVGGSHGEWWSGVYQSESVTLVYEMVNSRGAGMAKRCKVDTTSAVGRMLVVESEREGKRAERKKEEEEDEEKD